MVIVSLLFSTYLGDMVLRACAMLICMVWLYNDLDGSNSNPFVRNALNGCGFVAYGVGATAITAGTKSFTDDNKTWFLIIWLAIFTTSHAQDFADMEGDGASGRRTMPLVYGEWLSRSSLAIATLFWSFAALEFWGATFDPTNILASVVHVVLLGVGIGIAVLGMASRSDRANNILLRMWCLWTATLFLSPITCTRD